MCFCKNRSPVVRTPVSATPGFLFLIIKSTLSDNFFFLLFLEFPVIKLQRELNWVCCLSSYIWVQISHKPWVSLTQIWTSRPWSDNAGALLFGSGSIRLIFHKRAGLREQKHWTVLTKYLKSISNKFTFEAYLCRCATKPCAVSWASRTSSPC